MKTLPSNCIVCCRVSRGALVLAAALLVFFDASAKADIQTTLTFASPSTIAAGGTVTVDVGVNFIPIPFAATSTQYVNAATNTPLPDSQTCMTFLSTCLEEQTGTSTSTLTSLTAEVIAPNSTSGPPKSYSITSTGITPLVLSYPNLGTWQVTTTGSDKEEIVPENCVTIFAAGSPEGPPACLVTGSASFVSGKFNPSGVPVLTVSVTTIPEPASFALLAVSGIGLALWMRARAS